MTDELIDYAALCSYDKKSGYYYKTKMIGGELRKFRSKDPAKVFEKMNAALYPETVKPTFRRAAEEWQAKHWPQIKPNTQQCYNPALTRALEELGDRPVEEIIPAECERIIARLAAEGYSSKTVKTQKIVLKMIFDAAITHDPPWLLHNPMAAVTVPRGLPKKKRAAPEDDVMQTIFDRAGDAYFGLFPLLLLCTGCRRGEALALTWGDVDFKGETIEVSKAIVYTDGLPHLTTPKTEAGVRTVPLLPQLKAHLVRPDDAKDEAPIFPAPDGRYLNENAFRRRWRHYCKDAGLVTITEEERVSEKTKRHYIVQRTEPLISPHQLRHGFATLCFEAGVDELDCQGYMGHTDINLTHQIYTDLRARRREKSTKKLANYMKKTYHT